MTDKSLVGLFFNGDCPKCHSREMYRNVSGYYECLLCNLQIRIQGPASVMPEKGEGQFQLKDGRYISASDDGIHYEEIIYDFRVGVEKFSKFSRPTK